MVEATVDKSTWLVELPDGRREWRERVSGGYNVVKVEDTPVTASHSHEGLDQLQDIITLLNKGITGSKTIGGYKFTFNHGILLGFEEV